MDRWTLNDGFGDAPKWVDKVGDPSMSQLWHQLRWALPIWFIGLVTNWLPDNKVVQRMRGFLMSFFIGACGKHFMAGASITLINTHGLRIGNNVYLAKGSWLNSVGGLTIQDEVMLAPYVVISTAREVFQNGSVYNAGCILRPVIIGRGSWLAAHAVICGGVTVGKGNLVAANAVVTRDTPDHVIVGGVPAKVIGPNRDRKAE